MCKKEPLQLSVCDEISCSVLRIVSHEINRNRADIHVTWIIQGGQIGEGNMISRDGCIYQKALTVRIKNSIWSDPGNLNREILCEIHKTHRQYEVNVACVIQSRTLNFLRSIIVLYVWKRHEEAIPYSLIIYKLWIRFIKYESNPGIMSIHHQWVCYDMKNNNKLQHEMSPNSIEAFRVGTRIEIYFGIVLPFKEQFFLVPLLGQHSVGITNRLAPLYFYRGLLCLN